MIRAARHPRTAVLGAVLYQPLASGVPVASAISPASPQNQTGKAGGAPQTLPTVLVTSSGGAPVSGVTVTFAVTGGGGSATGLTPTTDSNGHATVGSWTLGTTTAPNTMTATSAGLSGSPVHFTVTTTGAPNVARIRHFRTWRHH